MLDAHLMAFIVTLTLHCNRGYAWICTSALILVFLTVLNVFHEILTVNGVYKKRSVKH